MTIDLKYKIPLQGEYHAGINDCPECNWRPSQISIIPHIIGFADSPIGIMVVCECPECFTKWHFHARDLESGTYYYFKEFIKFGDQLHYKDTEGKPEVLPPLVAPTRFRKK